MVKYFFPCENLYRATLVAHLLLSEARLMPQWLVLSALVLAALVQVSDQDITFVYKTRYIFCPVLKISPFLFRRLWSLHWCLHLLALDQQCSCCEFFVKLIIFMFQAKPKANPTILTGIHLVWLHLNNYCSHWWWHMQRWSEHRSLSLWCWRLWLIFWLIDSLYTANLFSYYFYQIEMELNLYWK